MPGMPDQQLQQKVQNLEKIEQYLKKQVSDLEDDRQELYDLLREDKKVIHDLKIKLRTLELSEENVKSRLELISEEESRLIEENYNLANKIQELELLLSLSSKKAGTDRGQVTDEYEPEQVLNLKSQLVEKVREIEDLKSKSRAPEKVTTHRQTDTEGLTFQDVNELLGKEQELKDLKDEIESLKNKLRTRSVTQREIQTEESTFDGSRGRHMEVQSDESFFHKRAEKTNFTQTEESFFDKIPQATSASQTEEVEVRDRRLTRNRDVQVDEMERSFLSVGVQTEDDFMLRDKLSLLERRLLVAEDDIKKKDKELEELQKVASEKHKEASKLESEGREHQEKVEKLTREGSLLKELFDKFVESSKSEKAKQEEEIRRLKDAVNSRESELNSATQQREEVLGKLRNTQMDLVSAETSRDEKAGILLNKVLEITHLKKNISDKDEEVKTLWTDMNKIQANYSNYIETSEMERALLENRLKETMKEVMVKGEELKEANKEKDTISEKLKKKEEEIILLTESKDDLMRESTQMKKTMKDREDELKLLIEDLNKLQARNASLVQEHEYCHSTHEELKKNLESCKSELKVLRDKNLDLTRQLEAKDAKIKILTSSNSDQEERIKSLEDENLNLRDKLNKTELRNELLNSTNEQKMRIITSTLLKHQTEKKSGEASAASQIAFLKKSLQSKDEEIQLLTNDINSLHKKYLELLEKPTKSQEDIQESAKSTNRLLSELTRKDDEIKTLMSNEESLQKKIYLLMEAVQQTKDTSEQEKKKLINDLRDKVQSLEDKNKELENTKQEVDDNNKRMNDLKEKLIQVTNALKASSQHNKELLIHQKNGKRLAEEKEELEKQLEKLERIHRSEVAKLRDAMEAGMKEKKELENSFDECKNRLMRVEREIPLKDQLQMKVNDLNASHREKDRQLLNLSEKVNSMRNEINNLLADKRNFTQKESYFRNLQNEVDRLNNICQKQSQDLKNYRTLENDLSIKLKEKDSVIKGLKSELSECMELSRKLNILNITR